MIDDGSFNAEHRKLIDKCIGMATIKTLGLSGAPHTFPSILNEANEDFLIRSFTRFDVAAMRLHFGYGVDPDARIRERRGEAGNE